MSTRLDAETASLRRDVNGEEDPQQSPQRALSGEGRTTPLYRLTCEECGKHTRDFKAFACYRTVWCPVCKANTEHA
jgi:hypothetical protein